jgi:hypothetical protein
MGCGFRELVDEVPEVGLVEIHVFVDVGETKEAARGSGLGLGEGAAEDVAECGEEMGEEAAILVLEDFHHSHMKGGMLTIHS